MITHEERMCQSCKNQFTIEPDDFAFYEKVKVPPPTWCPECRMIRRFLWRNERILFRRSDDEEHKEIFSTFHRDAPVRIYEHDFWWSDGWDPMEYAQSYDFNTPFFEQFRALIGEVPIPSRSVNQTLNSDYVNNVSQAKNSYLCFSGDEVENSAYVVGFTCVKDGFDLYQSRHTELCYDSYMVDESHRVFFSTNCEDSHDIWFSKNLLGCSNCFGCMNLRSKSYHIFNKPVSKEEYQSFINNFPRGSFQAVSSMRKKVHQFWNVQPNRFTLAIQTVRSSGEHIEHTKNVKNSYFIHEAENLRYCQILEGAVDCYDYTLFGANAARIYESSSAGVDADTIKFSSYALTSVQNLEYCYHCHSSSDLFGCVGLRKKQYCIFNKQYTKEEYFALREKIIAHMNEMPYTDKQGRVYRYGEFFPPEFSPFAYNETIAQDFFPLTKEQAETKGYVWREPERREFEITLESADLPDNIKEVSDDILQATIGCASCGRAYRIIPMELDFYRHITLPLPRLCPDCRFKERFKFVNPPKLWLGKCQCAGVKDERGIYANQNGGHFHGAGHCPNSFETSFAPGRPEIIYCAECYNAEAV